MQKNLLRSLFKKQLFQNSLFKKKRLLRSQFRKQLIQNNLFMQNS